MIINAKNLPKAIFVDGTYGTNPKELAKKLSYHVASTLEVLEIKELGVHKRRPAVVMHVDPFDRWEEGDIMRLRQSLINEDEEVLHMAWGAVHSARRQIDTIRHRNPDEHPDLIVASNWLGFFYSVTRDATQNKLTEPVKEHFNEFMNHPFLNFKSGKVIAINTFLTAESFGWLHKPTKPKGEKNFPVTFDTEKGYLPHRYLDRCGYRDNIFVNSVDASGLPVPSLSRLTFEYACNVIKKLIES